MGFLFLRTNCVTTLIISIQRRSIVPVCFILSSSSKMLGGGDDINDQITFRRLHSNVSSSPEYESTPSCLLPIPSSPTPPQPLRPSCLCCPSKLCISALGGKHYTGLAQGSVSLNILSWPLAVILLMARVSSSTFIRTSAEGEARERESCFFISERKKPKRRQETKMCQDLLMFYSVNQRCYLTQVPYVISITLMIPKITKDFFSLHGLYEWC